MPACQCQRFHGKFGAAARRAADWGKPGGPPTGARRRYLSLTHDDDDSLLFAARGSPHPARRCAGTSSVLSFPMTRNLTSESYRRLLSLSLRHGHRDRDAGLKPGYSVVLWTRDSDSEIIEPPRLHGPGPPVALRLARNHELTERSHCDRAVTISESASEMQKRALRRGDGCPPSPGRP